jgi:hypothetical protein
MAITSSYLVAVGKLGEMMEALRNAQPPERFTARFLEDMGYKSTNDRRLVALLKALGFLDQNGVPQQRYYDYLDESQSKQVLAEGVREAYEDLFRVNKNAHEMSLDQVKSKFKSLTQGQYTANVIKLMAATFVALVKLADFQAAAPKPQERGVPSPDQVVPPERDGKSPPPDDHPVVPSRLIDQLSYRIEIVLPATRDKAIYDSIFRSLKDHLL